MKRIGFWFPGLACLMSLCGGASAQTPPPPTDLTAHTFSYTSDDEQGVSSAVALAWQFGPTGSMDHTAFRVYRSVDDSLSFMRLDLTANHDYVDRHVSAGHTYYYYITAVTVVDEEVSSESPRSNTARATVSAPAGLVTGQVFGTVRDSVSGAPIAHVRIRFFRHPRETDDEHGQETWSDSLGRYSATLDTGTYLILAQPPFWAEMRMMPPAAPYRAKWYANAYGPDQATPVTVVQNGMFSADFPLVHFVIPVKVHARGTVRDSAGNALAGAHVLFLRTVQQMHEMAEMNEDATNAPEELSDLDDVGRLHGVVWGGRTDSAGAFDAALLSGNSYVALAEKKGYVPQFFDHRSQPADATILLIAGDTSGIDFNLNLHHPPQTYTVSGSVRDSGGVSVPSRIILFPLRPHTEHAERFVSTDSMGIFTAPNVRAGKYIVLAIPYGRFAPAFYRAGAFGVMHWKDADTVNVTSNVTGIDIGVVAVASTGFAMLRGTIDTDGKGVNGISVYAQAAGGVIVGYAMSDNTGTYRMSGLPPGPVTLYVDGEGYDPVTQQIVLAPSGYALTQDFTLSPATALPGSPGGDNEPSGYALAQNYPNPFNPRTTIRFSLPVAGNVTLRVFDILGQQITTLASGAFGAGTHALSWDGRDTSGRQMASGVYFYRVEAAGLAGVGPFTAMKRMLLLK